MKRQRVSDQVVRRIFADYQRLGSLEAAAKLHGRKLQTLWAIFARRGLIVPRCASFRRRRVMQMYFGDYVANRMSLGKVAAKHGRSRQAVFDMFKVRGLKLRAKEFLPAVCYKGRKYTCQLTGSGRRRRHRYLRATVRRRDGTNYLHHAIWEEHNGPVPPGYKVCFIDGNHLNCAIDNLELLSNSDQPRKHATGANQFTATAKSRLNLLVGNFESGAASTAVALKRRAA
jgi:hypothetical protein